MAIKDAKRNSEARKTPKTGTDSCELGPSTPPLENGDRLTRDEFERRYDAMPDLKKAELIKGVVYMGSPVRFGKHGEPHARLLTWLGTYVAFTQGVGLGDNATVRLASDTEPQPDALLRVEAEDRANSRISADDYVEGAPELVAEIFSSTASYDLHDKMDAYRRAGVKEYLVWRVEDREFDWFILRNGEYVRIVPDADGICDSRNFPGLRLTVTALLVGDMARVMGELQKGLDAAEHTAFVASLR
ncbi:MAG: Uma2 family endonuclease [Deltaproteobacteria bacterium]|nr:Uma2 family endonuclease [Deltaproteobacteria bacterium]